MPSRPAIKLNGVVLPPQMIAAEAQHHPAETPAEAFLAAARAIIVRTLLLEEVKRRGLESAPQMIEPGKRELPDEASIRILLETAVPIAEPQEAECRAYYDANPGRFRSPDLFEVSHILFAADPGDLTAYAAAAERAGRTGAILSKEPGRFEALAKEHSDCASRENGGRLGQLVARDSVPEFERVLLTLEEGEIAPAPVQTRFGAHVVRLDARARGESLPFDYVREKIALFLAERAWRHDIARFIDQLVDTATIEGIVMRPAQAGAAA